MKLATPLLSAAAAAAVVGGGLAVDHSRSSAQPLVTRQAAPPPSSPQLLASSTTGAPTVTVVGNGTVSGTPDESTMQFAVTFSAGSAASALSGEAARAQKLIDALKSAGIAQPDIQTAYVSLYRNEQTGEFDASSSLSAVIHGISHIGPTIDAAVAAAGDSVSFGGISLSIADTSALMGSARAAAVHDAQAKAQQYAQAAGMKLGSILSISEVDTTPRPIYYGNASPTAVGQAQPIEPGQQSLSVSVTVVYALQ